MGERLTLGVNEVMFSAILKNEIGWFDDLNNSSSMLASRLESDAAFLKAFKAFVYPWLFLFLFLDLYARELVEPSKRLFTRGQIAGIFYDISQFFIFYGLGLWHGSVLMGKELASF
ncbi:hypothetical protein V6N13_073338 [Hibiscus sabdariffa]|uniref:ABC transmembrane type-1 domain-containing protein n=1 Tax=Hibiscus sabdariffa TaxID=183260 RepID=A0ABR2BEX3_9ROSI